MDYKLMRKQSRRIEATVEKWSLETQRKELDSIEGYLPLEKARGGLRLCIFATGYVEHPHPQSSPQNGYSSVERVYVTFSV